MSEMTTFFKKETRNYLTEVFENFNELTKPKDNYSDDEFFGLSDRIVPYRVQGVFKTKYKSQDETVFLENYANVFAELVMRKKTLVIEENENKIALKLYHYRNYRDAGKKYFKVRREISYLTFNIKRKTFYSGQLRLKKRAKIGSKMSIHRTDIHSMEVYNAMLYFNPEDTDMDNSANEVINLFLNRVSERMGVKFDKDSLTPRDKFYQLYLKISDIKYPDAFSKFVTYYTPKKEIRENGNNLVTWFMKKNEFKGTKIRELLNKYNNVDMNGLTIFYQLLGQDLFNTINSECFLTENRLGSDYFGGYYGNLVSDTEKISKKELENICKILNTTTSETLLNSLSDHIQYKASLKKYGEFVKITATNYDDYVKEHSEWSSLVQSYRTGVVTRFYGEDSYLIEKPINDNGETYYPVLLKTTEQYEGESMVQNNCVRTYSEKPYCFIVSLRKGDVNGNDRASIEFRYTPNGVKVVQKLGRFNKGLSEEWLSPIYELEEFANYLYSKSIIKLPEMLKRFPNGKVIKSFAEFKDEDKIKNMYPVWVNNNSLLENDSNYYLFEDLP